MGIHFRRAVPLAVFLVACGGIVGKGEPRDPDAATTTPDEAVTAPPVDAARPPPPPPPPGAFELARCGPVVLLEGRAPNDLDVVSFYRLPPSTSQADLAAKLGAATNHAAVKATYLVDGYLVHLGMPPERLTHQSAYWYSVWSHRRNQVWKGFVQIDLAPTEDATALATLASLAASGGNP